MALTATDFTVGTIIQSMLFNIIQLRLITTCIWAVVVALIANFCDMVLKVAVGYRVLITFVKRASKGSFLKNLIGHKIYSQLVVRCHFSFTIAQITQSFATFLHACITN